MNADEEVARHRASGRVFEAAGVRSFALDEGTGEAVLCLHGVPASSYLYRKVVRGVAGAGMRGIAIDLPGLGLAERPPDFDYSWSGLGRFVAAAIDALELDRVHLVVHDIGGPVGFELVSAEPGRIASLTLLNTLVDVDGFVQPWPMRPFALPLIDRLWLGGMSPFVFRQLMALKGVRDMSKVGVHELGAHLALLRGDDGGRAFLRIMKGFEPTAEKQALYRSVVGRGPFPVHVVWFRHDTALAFDPHGTAVARAAGVEATLIDGRHFAQEDNPEGIVRELAAFIGGEEAVG